jgi:probable phosphoglycerate mutase
MTTPHISSETILFLMRHGAIETGNEKRFIGQIDLPLSRDGQKQSERQGRFLMDIPFSQVWCSDLKRTRETAAIVCRDRDPVIHSAPELREIDLGRWDGMPMSQIKEQFPDIWQARGQDISHFRLPGAESFADLQQRTVPFIRQIAEQSSGNILIVTHAGVIRVLLCRVLEMPLSHLFRIYLDYGGLTLIKDIKGMSQVMGVNLSPALPATDDLT